MSIEHPMVLAMHRNTTLELLHKTLDLLGEFWPPKKDDVNSEAFEQVEKYLQHQIEQLQCEDDL
jgi:hypothetical protein